MGMLQSDHSFISVGNDGPLGCLHIHETELLDLPFTKTPTKKI